MLKKLAEKIKTAYSNHKKLRLIGIDYGEPGGDHTAVTKIPANQAATAGEALREMNIKLSASGITTENLANAITEATKSLQDELNHINRQNTNNWRKMHGLPMRRKRIRQKKRK